MQKAPVAADRMNNEAIHTLSLASMITSLCEVYFVSCEVREREKERERERERETERERERAIARENERERGKSGRTYHHYVICIDL